MSSLSRRNFAAPLFLVFLMVAMSWSSVLDNRHDAQTETSLSDVVVSHVGWGSPTTIDSVGRVGEDPSLAIDSNDNLHVTYHNVTHGNLDYMIHDGSSWSTPVSLDSTGNVGRESSLAIDSNDNLHVTYYDKTNGNLEYMTYDGSSWSTPVSLDSTDDVGEESSLAIDSNDNLHVTYRDSTNNNLEYMTYDGSSWSTPVSLDSTDDIGYDSSLAIDSNDNLHVTYYDWTGGNLEYMTHDGSSWSTPVSLDTFQVVGYSPSLAIDSNDNLHVTYYALTPGNLEYMTHDGSSWSTPASLDSTGDVGSDSSLAIDSNDNLHVTYLDYSNGNLEYMTYDGSSWSTPVSLDSTDYVGVDSSLAIDSNDNLHVAYYDETSDNLEYVTYSTPAPPVISYSPSELNLTNNTLMSVLSPTNTGGSIGAFSTVSGIVNVTLDSTGRVGDHNSIAIDSNDHSHLAYYYSYNAQTVEDLIYATDKSGSWVITTLDSADSVGMHTSIAIDSNSAVHISYYDETNNDLKYATDKSGSWILTTVDSTGDVGVDTSIDIDSNDSVHISYYDSTNDDLKYATDKSGSWVNTTLDSSATMGRYSSIALDSNDAVHISYNDVTNRTLKYATDKSSTWVLSTLDSSNSVGRDTSIDIDSNDKIHISYLDYTSWDLRYATDKTGSWVFSTIDSAGNVGWYTSTALDSNDAVHISYYYDPMGNGNGEALKYATDKNGSWVMTTLVSISGKEMGRDNEIALDSNNEIHIVYQDQTSHDLLYLQSTTTVVNGFSISPSLSPGLDFNTSSGDISGTPTIILGKRMYTITGTNPNGTETAYINITVVDNLPNISYSPDDLSLTNNTASSDVPLSPTLTGSGVITSWTIHPTLPNGLSFSTSNGTITGTPIELLTRTMFTVNGTNTGGSSTAYVNITVNAVTPVLSYTPDSLVLTNNSAMNTLSPTTLGGDIVSWSIDPALSSGLMFNTANGEISGIPDALSVLTVYTISATNTGGTVTATVNITVNAVTPVLSYTPDSLVLTNNSAMTTLSSTTPGEDIVSWSIDPALSSGLTFNTANGEISGIPDALSVLTVYTISATNTGGTVTATVNITVNAVAPVLSYSPDSFILTNNSAMTTFSPTTSGGDIVTWSIDPALSSGLTFNTASGEISGIPDALSVLTVYTISATNTGGTVTTTVNITVNAVAPVLSYSPDSFILTNNSAMTTFSPTTSGGDIVTWSIDPALSSGLTFNTASGEISGIPDALSVLTVYTISATNTGGTVTTTVNITVNAEIAVISYSSSNLTLTRSLSMPTLSPTVAGGGVVSWEINPQLPSGLQFGSSNGSVWGASSVNMSQIQYTVWANNSGGSAVALLNITVVEPVAIIGYSPDSLTLIRTQSMTSIMPVMSGGQVETWEIEPTLPLGLSFSNGVLSGTPEVNMTLTSYTIWANNSGGASFANITLLIHEPIPEVTYSPENIVLTRGQNIAEIAPSLGEGMVAIWEISPSLPDGLVFENGGISGTPVVNFTMTQYTVIAQNSGGSYTVTFNLTVVEPVAILSIESNPPVLLRDNSSLALNITNDGGMVDVWEISPSLPDGLVMENGSVSGISSVNQSETIFTIWGNNSGGSDSVTFTLTVQEPEIPIVEQLPEQEPEVSINLFILSMIFFVPFVALIIVFKKHYELMY